MTSRPTITITAHSATWSKVHSGVLEIGGFGETTRDEPDMRWHWSGQSTYGYCATRGEAIAALAALVSTAERFRDADAAKQAEFDAMPADLQKLKAAVDRAEIERMRAWGRDPFNETAYRAASDREYRARLVFEAAKEAWASQREAA